MSLSEAEIVEAFNKFDADGSGDIDAGELRLALEAAGLKVSGEQCEYMLRKYDDDRGASLDLEEFSQLVRDLHVNTDESVQARLNLRTHPQVVGALDAWWDTACTLLSSHELGAAEATEDAQLTHDAYIAVIMKIFKALTDDWDEADAKATAEGEWDHDRKGFDHLDSELFKDGIFELADLYTTVVSGEEYARWLWDLFKQVAECDSPGKYKWKSDAVIVSDPTFTSRPDSEAGEADDKEEENEEATVVGFQVFGSKGQQARRSKEGKAGATEEEMGGRRRRESFSGERHSAFEVAADEADVIDEDDATGNAFASAKGSMMAMRASVGEVAATAAGDDDSPACSEDGNDEEEQAKGGGDGKGASRARRVAKAGPAGQTGGGATGTAERGAIEADGGDSSQEVGPAAVSNDGVTQGTLANLAPPSQRGQAELSDDESNYGTESVASRQSWDEENKRWKKHKAVHKRRNRFRKPSSGSDNENISDPYDDQKDKLFSRDSGSRGGWKPTASGKSDALWETTKYGDNDTTSVHGEYGDAWRHNDIRNMAPIARDKDGNLVQRLPNFRPAAKKQGWGMSDPIYEGIEAPTPPKMSRREEVEAARRANANTWKPTQVQDTLWEQTSYGDTVLSGQHASYGDSWRHNDIRNLPAIGPSTTLRSGSIMADTGIERAKERRKSVLVVPSTEESSFVCTSSSGREELSSAHTPRTWQAMDFADNSEEIRERMGSDLPSCVVSPRSTSPPGARVSRERMLVAPLPRPSPRVSREQAVFAKMYGRDPELKPSGAKASSSLAPRSRSASPALGRTPPKLEGEVPVQLPPRMWVRPRTVSVGDLPYGFTEQMEGLEPLKSTPPADLGADAAPNQPAPSFVPPRTAPMRLRSIRPPATARSSMNSQSGGRSRLGSAVPSGRATARPSTRAHCSSSSMSERGGVDQPPQIWTMEAERLEALPGAEQVRPPTVGEHGRMPVGLRVELQRHVAGVKQPQPKPKKLEKDHMIFAELVSQLRSDSLLSQLDTLHTSQRERPRRVRSQSVV